MKIRNKWRAQVHFVAFAVWVFNALLAFGWHRPFTGLVSVVVALGYLLLGVLTFRKPDDPDPPRGTGGFCAA